MTEATVTQALEPCPAGHDSAALEYDDEFETFFVHCEAPNCHWRTWDENDSLASAAWNARAAASQASDAGEHAMLEAVVAAQEVQPYRGWNLTALNKVADRIREHLGLPSIRDLNPDIAKMQDHAEENKDAILATLTAPPTSDAGEDVNAIWKARDALVAHHQWHAARTDPDPEHGFIPADEYADSSLYEQTVAAICALDPFLRSGPRDTETVSAAGEVHAEAQAIADRLYPAGDKAANSRNYIAFNSALTALSPPTSGEEMRLREMALTDDPDWIAAGIPDDAIEAGMQVFRQVDADNENYVAGETTDWDEGMIVAAIFKAVARAALSAALDIGGGRG